MSNKFDGLSAVEQVVLSIPMVRGNKLENGVLWSLVPNKLALSTAPLEGVGSSFKEVLASSQGVYVRYWGAGGEFTLVEVAPKNFFNTLAKVDGKKSATALQNYMEAHEKAIERFTKYVERVAIKGIQSGQRVYRLGLFSVNSEVKATAVDGSLVDAYQLNFEDASNVLHSTLAKHGYTANLRITPNVVVKAGVQMKSGYQLSGLELSRNENAVIVAFEVVPFQ